jgi:hypothetical protein
MNAAGKFWKKKKNIMGIMYVIVCCICCCYGSVAGVLFAVNFWKRIMLIV